MNTYPKVPAVLRACTLVDGAGNLAALVGVTQPAVYQWLHGLRRVPAARCPAVERATKGAVRCEELRPDVDWAILRVPAQAQEQEAVNGFS